MTSEWIYRQATLDEIYHLRFAVLRPGHAVVRVYFTGDDQLPPLAWHFGAFTTDAEQNIGCLTLLATRFEGQDAIQLRGMAVASEWQRGGVGSKLLATAEASLKLDASVCDWPWWCNARVEAIGFYRRNDWRVISEEFMVEGVGPHRKMIKDMAPRA